MTLFIHRADHLNTSEVCLPTNSMEMDHRLGCIQCNKWVLEVCGTGESGNHALFVLLGHPNMMMAGRGGPPHMGPMGPMGRDPREMGRDSRGDPRSDPRGDPRGNPREMGRDREGRDSRETNRDRGRDRSRESRDRHSRYGAQMSLTVRTTKQLSWRRRSRDRDRSSKDPRHSSRSR